MRYDRKIKYFDYMEKGERLRNGGFVKLERRDDICHIFIQISGFYRIENSTRDVFFLAEGQEEKLGEIFFQQGKGSLQLHRNSENLCSGLEYDKLEAIRIPIAQERELYCKIVEKIKQQETPVENIHQTIEQQKPPVENMHQTIEQQKPMPESTIQKSESRKTEIENQGVVRIEEGFLAKSPEWKSGEELTTENIERIHGEEGFRENIEWQRGKERTAESQEPKQKKGLLMEDKWKQLSAVYPHIAPFQDDREYLSIGPGDFVVLPQQYYRLVNNSFLLHGFYNYKHLILTRMERRGEMAYYIGVPGNFYDREKQVAVMFGFESFECREEPAGNGDYGYYMMRVEI